MKSGVATIRIATRNTKASAIRLRARSQIGLRFATRRFPLGRLRRLYLVSEAISVLIEGALLQHHATINVSPDTAYHPVRALDPTAASAHALRPMDIDFSARLKDDADAVESVLTDLLRPRDSWPSRLTEALRYAALGAGKRLRPFVLIESAKLFGLEGKGVLFAAAALECVHCYSLAHDDLPAMDDDDLRRGRPTVHLAFDEATAILVGDTLLTLAFEILANRATAADAEIRVELAEGLARAAGAGGMAGGQALDLAGERRALTEDEIAILQAMKTGALFRYAAEAGAIIAGAGTTDRERVASFGSALGAAFQLADDLLDHAGDSASLGKVSHRDAERQKPTLVALLGEREARTALATRIAAAKASLAPYGDKAATLIAAARFVGERN